MHVSPPRPHVVIAGGGIAAVECALALRDLAGDRVRMTIVAPNEDFALTPLRTAEPFARDHVRRFPLAAVARQVGAELVAAPLTRVRPELHRLVAGHRTIAYDQLVLALGARRVPAYAKAITFTGDATPADLHGLLQDVDEGYTRALSFVVPPGVTWPLPLYELALMTAREAYGMGIDGLDLELVTPEAAPLAVFGPRASEAMRAVLAEAGVAFRGGVYVREPLDAARRVVALPTLRGVPVPGIPGDRDDFLGVDAELRVRGVADVHAAGDGASFPIKQGGIACQQADAIAERIAAAAGAPVVPRPFRPVLRGRVLTGRGAQYLEHALAGGDGEGPAAEPRDWSATRKVDGRYLSPWLEAQDAGALAARA